MSSLATLLFAAAMAATPQNDPAASTDYQAELKALLDASLASKKGVVFHVQGETIPGVVKQVLSDAVVVSNQQRSRIVIRMDRIDAVEAD